MLCALLNIGAGVVIILLDPGASMRYRAASVAVPAMVLAMLAIGFVPWGRPVFLYSHRYHTMAFDDRVLYYREGQGATVTVRQLGPWGYSSMFSKLIEVNGVAVAGTSEMLRVTQKLQGHFPLLLYKAATGKDPRLVFILGLATGESSHCITRHNIERLDCLELAAAELDANHFFHDINHRILEEPKFKLHFDDARNFLLTTPHQYDVIESDAIHPDIDISTFTREYFEICKAKLTDDGLLSTWIPLYDLTEDNLKILMNTLHSVFPHVMVWYVPYWRSKHALLMGLKKRLTINVGMLDQELSRPAVRRSLAGIQMADKYEFLRSFLADEQSAAPILQAGLVNDDNHLYLPYLIPRQAKSGEGTVVGNLSLLLKHRADIFSYLDPAEKEPVLDRDTLRQRIQAHDHAILGLAASYADNLPSAITWYKRALELDPANPNLQKLYLIDQTMLLADEAFKAIRSGQVERGIKLIERAVEINPHYLVIRNWLGMAYLQTGRLGKADSTYQDIIQSAPEYTEAHYNLANVYLRKGRALDADRHLRQVLKLNPYCQPAQQMLKYIMKGQYR
jgi:spermidine synthase